MNCKKCGNSILDGEVCENCKLEEKIESTQSVTKEKEMSQQDSLLGLSEEKPFSAKKVASICAIFAPVSVIVCNLLSEISVLFRQLPYSYYGDFYDYEKLLVSSSIISVGVSIFNILVYFLIYMLFTRKYREQLPLLFFVIAPGTAIFTTPLLYITSVFQQSVISALLYIVVFFAETVIAYFVARAIFIKLLKTKTNK